MSTILGVGLIAGTTTAKADSVSDLSKQGLGRAVEYFTWGYWEFGTVKDGDNKTVYSYVMHDSKTHGSSVAWSSDTSAIKRSADVAKNKLASISWTKKTNSTGLAYYRIS